WRSVEDRIVGEWVQTRPGHRPLAWWLWSSPTIRKPLGGTGRAYLITADRVPPFHHFYMRRSKSLPWFYYDARFGIPSCWELDSLDPSDPPVFESEPEYLRHHKLLFKGEKPAPEAFEPVSLTIEPDRAAHIGRLIYPG